MSYLLGKKAGSGGGTEVIANPELAGTEDNLTGLQVGNTKYKVSEVNANPTLAGTEAELTGLEVDNTKYKIDTKEHYSTTEQVVGTWTNGKPVYRRVFTATTTSTNRETSVDFLDTSILDEIISLHGSVKEVDLYGNIAPVPYWKGSSDFAYSYYASSGKIFFQSGSSHGYGIFKVVVEYTKIAD